MNCRIWKAPKLEVGCYRYLFRRHQFAANSYESTDARTHARVHASLFTFCRSLAGEKVWVGRAVLAPPHSPSCRAASTFSSAFHWNFCLSLLQPTSTTYVHQPYTAPHLSPFAPTRKSRWLKVVLIARPMRSSRSRPLRRSRSTQLSSPCH